MRKGKPGSRALVMAAGALALAAVLALAACSAPAGENGGMAGGADPAANTGGDTGAYHKITAEEAKALIDEGGVTVVDVRTPKEYADGHVPGAINIPVEGIGNEKPSELDDVDAELIVYCRTGVRSKQASDKLIGLGYRHVNDMGGIVDWTGDTVSGDRPN